MANSKERTCPKCGRAFHSFLDYPIVKVKNAEFIDPDQVPDVLVGEGDYVDRVDRSKIPIEHFAKEKDLNPGDDYEFLGDDGYVYSISWVHFTNEILWSKKRNWSGMVKDVLASDDMTRYKKRVLDLVGKIVDPDLLRPDGIIDPYYNDPMVMMDFEKGVFVYVVLGKEENGKVKIHLLKNGPSGGAMIGPTWAYLLSIGEIDAFGMLED